jgi:hypothetical protein
MSRDSGRFHYLVRAAQSVLHTRIHDRHAADIMGHGIADFVISNWGTVIQDFGCDDADEIEIMERVTRIVLRELAN